MKIEIGKEELILIHNIASEKVLCDADIDGAINFIKEALNTTDDKIAEKILKCEICLLPDEEDGHIKGVQRNQLTEEELKDYPVISAHYVYNHIENKISGTINLNYDDVAYFYRRMDYITDMVLCNKKFNNIECDCDVNDGISVSGTCDISAREIVKDIDKYVSFVNDYNITNNKFYEAVKIVEFARDLAQNRDKYIKCLKWARENCDDVDDELKYKMRRLESLLIDTAEFYWFNNSYKSKNNTDIHPSNPKGKYDAGFISPEGRFYGMNGESASLLHIQLADRISEALDLVVYDKCGGIDYYLETLGWIKVRRNEMIFCGCTYNKKMTTAQKDEMAKIAEAFGGKAFIGFFKMTTIEADRIPLLTDEEIEKLCS